jgi:cytochrome c peroxidase
LLLFSTSPRAEVTLDEGELALITAFGPWPAQVPSDPGNEFSGLTWAESLGEHLFHDKSLSGDQNMSCATCHIRALGFTDGRNVAVGKEQHVRNTQGLFNAGYQRWFGWDGGADSLWAASIRPMLSDIEMNATVAVIAERFKDNTYVTTSLKKAGVANINSDEQWLVTIAKLLAAYQRTLVSPETAFDQYRTALLNEDVTAQQRYPESAKRGLKLFFGAANCHVCHFGPNFSNGEFHDTGRPFFTSVGKVDPGRYSGVKRVTNDVYNLAGRYNGTMQPAEIRKTTTVKIGQSNFGQWKTPSLRNLTLHARWQPENTAGSSRQLRRH